MPRPDLKSLPITEWFKPRTVSEQLEEMLEKVGGAMGNYKHDMNRWTNMLTQEKHVLRPYYIDDQGNPMDFRRRWQATIELIINLQSGQVLIIPYDAGIMPLVSRATLAKKGRLLKARYDPETGVDSATAVKNKLRQETLDDLVVGVDLQGAHWTEKDYRPFTLYDCIRANIAKRELPKGIVKVKDAYIPTSSRLWREGGFITISNIPSFRENEQGSYEVTFENLPVKPYGFQITPERGQEIAKASFDFSALHVCEKIKWFSTVKYGREGHGETRTGRERGSCHHIIFAASVAEEYVAEKYPKQLEMVNPFPKHSEKTESFFWKLLTQAILERRIKDGSLRRTPFAESEMNVEIALHKYAAYNNT
ncbi:MAG: hypothetical protein V1702_02925 [Candidatus Woesearchaeota archaeon]